MLGAPAEINPLSNSLSALGARLLVNGVSGMADYSLASIIDGDLPSAEGLGISAGVGLGAGVLGEILLRFQSPLLKKINVISTTKSEYTQTLRTFLNKQLLVQADDDLLRSSWISQISNYTQSATMPQ